MMSLLLPAATEGQLKRAHSSRRAASVASAASMVRRWLLLDAQTIGQLAGKAETVGGSVQLPAELKNMRRSSVLCMYTESAGAEHIRETGTYMGWAVLLVTTFTRVRRTAGGGQVRVRGWQDQDRAVGLSVFQELSPVVLRDNSNVWPAPLDAFFSRY